MNCKRDWLTLKMKITCWKIDVQDFKIKEIVCKLICRKLRKKVQRWAQWPIVELKLIDSFASRFKCKSNSNLQMTSCKDWEQFNKAFKTKDGRQKRRKQKEFKLKNDASTLRKSELPKIEHCWFKYKKQKWWTNSLTN